MPTSGYDSPETTQPAAKATSASPVSFAISLTSLVIASLSLGIVVFACMLASTSERRHAVGDRLMGAGAALALLGGVVALLRPLQRLSWLAIGIVALTFLMLVTASKVL